MRIVHFSDWHWSFHDLPEADVYVCTGDMYLNYAVIDPKSHGTRWAIDPVRERTFQLMDAMVFSSNDGGFRKHLGSPNAPILCVRGNHDFADLGPLFDGCNLIHEFIDNEVVEVLGKRFTGHRGIPFIQGTWNDETKRAVLYQRVVEMESADVYLTHYPPHNVLDYEAVGRGRIEMYGLEGMRECLEAKMPDRGLHCFGHIHGCGGMRSDFGPGSVIDGAGPWHTYSNAACNINVIEI